MLHNLFLNENWLDCNENLEVGNLDPLIQILMLRYYENSSHLLQNAKIPQCKHFICSAHNYNFIQIKRTCILYLVHQKNPHTGPGKLQKVTHSLEMQGTVRVHHIVYFLLIMVVFFTICKNRISNCITTLCI